MARIPRLYRRRITPRQGKKKFNKEIAEIARYLVRRKDGQKVKGKEDEGDAAIFLTDFAMMDRFGWTPEQIRELTPRDYTLIASTLTTLEELRKSKTSTPHK